MKHCLVFFQCSVYDYHILVKCNSKHARHSNRHGRQIRKLPTESVISCRCNRRSAQRQRCAREYSSASHLLQDDITTKSMMEYDKAEQLSSKIPISESLPLAVLAIEAACGVVCNGGILLLFYLRPTLLRTASDLFTINLSLVDLIFSGIVLPIVIVSGMMTASLCDTGTNTLSGVETAKNCIVLCGTLAAALGTLLVSLDRGDVSLKPSTRFFTNYRAIVAISITWGIAILGLTIALLPSLMSIDESNGDDNNSKLKKARNTSGHISSFHMLTVKNNTSILHFPNKISKDEAPCCSSYPCNISSIQACTFQLVFELPIFVISIITIVGIYMKILWSVQRRSQRYMHNSQKPKSQGYHKTQHTEFFSNFRYRYCKLKSCCKGDQASLEGNSEKTSLQNPPPTCTASKTSTEKKPPNIGAMKTDAKYMTTAMETQQQDPNCECDESENVTVTPSTSYPSKTAGTCDSSKESCRGKRDFASVAMSVTVVLAIKRMAARKIKERRRKMRHLRKMTFFIISTFLISWSPYYVTKLSVAITVHSRSQIEPSANDSKLEATAVPNSSETCTPSWLFTWTLAIAACSCILNPALYMFSREKIRLEFSKVFFARCGKWSSGNSFHAQSCLSSCLVCWDMEDNIGRRPTDITSGNMFRTGWLKQSAGKAVTKLRRSSEATSRHDYEYSRDAYQTNNTSPRRKVEQTRLPQIDVSEYEDSIPGTVTDRNKNSNHLSVTPIDALSHVTGGGSFEIKSEDMPSFCDTSTASVDPDL